MNLKFKDQLGGEDSFLEIKTATALDAELDEEGNPLAKTAEEDEELEDDETNDED